MKTKMTVTLVRSSTSLMIPYRYGSIDAKRVWIADRKDEEDKMETRGS